jgi:hypothetical protein
LDRACDPTRGGDALNSLKRPVSIAVLAAIYLIIGTVGFVFHGREIMARHAFHSDDFLVELTELIALITGIFLFRGHNWARWVALAWMIFHVVLSAFGPPFPLVVHALFCIVIAWMLFRPDAGRYFRGAGNEAG